MTDLLQRVEREIRDHRLFARGQKILVAVSGGVDSMVLLRVLHSLALKHRWRVSAAHFNHRLRGRASDADEALVRHAARALKLPIAVERADVKSFAKRSRLSLEMAARKLRHEFLARAARKEKFKMIALAHHADDQVELFFLRLLRGAGGEGLSGMKRRSPSPADRNLLLARPLLGFSKAELRTFARENKIRFREDATNVSADFLRNRIRNELLPWLRQNYQPALDKTVLRLMDIVGAEADFAGAAARLWERGGAGGRVPALRGAVFDYLPVAVQRRVLLLRLAKRGVAADFNLVESLRRTPDVPVSAGLKTSVSRDQSGGIKLRMESEPAFDGNELAVPLSGRRGEAAFDGGKLKWQIVAGGKGRSRPEPVAMKPKTELFDADQVGDTIILRHWRPGDRFQPIGLRAATKLQDLFVNAKIPRGRRRALVLAATARGEIFWVDGLRIGERFKLSAQTARTLAWQWSNLPV